MPQSWLKQQLSAKEDSPLRFVFKKNPNGTTAPKFSVHGAYLPWDFSQAMPKTKGQGRLMSS